MRTQGIVGSPQAGHTSPDSLTIPPIENFGLGFCILQSSLQAHVSYTVRCGISGQKSVDWRRQVQPLPSIFSSPTCGLFQEGLPVLDGLVNVLLAVHNLIIQSLGGGGKKPTLRNVPGKDLRVL